MKEINRKNDSKKTRGFSIDPYGNIRITKSNNNRTSIFKLTDARNKASKFK